MNWQNMLGDLVNQYAGGATPATQQEAHGLYDQIASAVPGDLLGSTIGPALASLGTQQVMEHVFNSASAMSPQQREGLVGSLLSGFSSSGIDVGSLLSRLGISQSVADNPQEASPEDVAKLAAHAHENQPGLFNQAMSFYAEHPTLVKAMGAVAVAAIARHISNSGSSST